MSAAAPKKVPYNFVAVPQDAWRSLRSTTMTTSELNLWGLFGEKTWAWHREECEMGQSEMMRGTGLSESSAKRALAGLVRRGLVTQIAPPAFNKPARYRVNRESTDAPSVQPWGEGSDLTPPVSDGQGEGSEMEGGEGSNLDGGTASQSLSAKPFAGPLKNLSKEGTLKTPPSSKRTFKDVPPERPPRDRIALKRATRSPDKTGEEEEDE